MNIFIHGCSSVEEDCEEAFVKNPDGHPLVLYLRTDEDHNLTGPTRQLLERVNAADKAAKVKVCVWYRWNRQGGNVDMSHFQNVVEEKVVRICVWSLVNRLYYSKYLTSVLFPFVLYFFILTVFSTTRQTAFPLFNHTVLSKFTKSRSHDCL